MPSRAPLAYRLLLRAYPRAFRDLWAADLEADFGRLLEKARRKGVGAVARLWMRTAWDVVRTGLAERVSRRGYRFGRSRLRLPRRSLAAALADLGQDVRLALRGLRGARGYVLAVVATLALGIGANTALFSVAYGVLLKPLPFGSGERLVRLVQEAPLLASDDEGSRRMGFSVLDLEDFSARSTTLEEVAEYHRMAFTLVDDGGPHRIRAGVVSSNYSDFLGLRPLHGRLFDPAEDVLGAEPVLVLAHDYWVERFGGDPAVVGRRVRMDGREHEIVGVLPPTPQFPDQNDVYLPISVCPIRSNPDFMADRTGGRMMYAYGRLSADATVADARLDLERVAGDLRRQHPDAYPLGTGYEVGAIPLRDELVAGARPVVMALVAISGFLLLIACANAAGLALARAQRRTTELAVRNALGAGRGRLVRSLLTESVILALAGGILGLLVAVAGHDVLVRFAARFTTRAQEIELDTTVLSFTLATSVLTGLLFGAAPGWLAGLGAHAGPLDGMTATGRRRQRRAQRLLVAGQVAVASAVLATAGVVVRTAWRVSHQEVGFPTESVLAVGLAFDGPRYDELAERLAFWEAVLDEAGSLPGVMAVGRSMDIPLGPVDHDHRDAFFFRGTPEVRGSASAAAWRVVDRGFFQVLDVPLVEGKGPEEVEEDDGRVAWVNQTFHERFMKGRVPLGVWLRHCQSEGSCAAPMRVVGVVGDIRHVSPDRPAIPEVYEPAWQVSWAGEGMVLRVAGDPGSVEQGLRAILAELDPELAVARVSTLEDLRREHTAPHRFFALLLGLFSTVGVGLALAGVFGITSLAAAARLRELGVRRVLGAEEGSLRHLVLREGTRVIVPGLVVGLAGSVAGWFLMGRVLEARMAPAPLVLAATALLFLVTGLMASWLPARRAGRVDVMRVLDAP